MLTPVAAESDSIMTRRDKIDLVLLSIGITEVGVACVSIHSLLGIVGIFILGIVSIRVVFIRHNVNKRFSPVVKLLSLSSPFIFAIGAISGILSDLTYQPVLPILAIMISIVAMVIFIRLFQKLA